MNPKVDSLAPAVSLLELLQTENAHVAEFCSLLESEAALLVRVHRPDEIQQLTDCKVALSEQLERDGIARDAWRQSVGMADDATALEALALDDEEVKQEWVRLQELSQRAALLNRQNGLVLEVYLTHVRDALAHIRATQGRTALYDARGRVKAASRSGSRSVAK